MKNFKTFILMSLLTTSLTACGTPSTSNTANLEQLEPVQSSSAKSSQSSKDWTNLVNNWTAKGGIAYTLFNASDINKNGKLTQAEISSNTKDKVLKDLFIKNFTKSDVNKDKNLSLYEFGDLTAHVLLDSDKTKKNSVSNDIPDIQPEEVLEMLFKLADPNDDAKITKTEFINCFTPGLDKVAQEAITISFNKFDINKNKSLDKKEFLAYLKESQAQDNML